MLEKNKERDILELMKNNWEEVVREGDGETR